MAIKKLTIRKTMIAISKTYLEPLLQRLACHDQQLLSGRWKLCRIETHGICNIKYEQMNMPGKQRTVVQACSNPLASGITPGNSAHKGEECSSTRAITRTPNERMIVENLYRSALPQACL